VNGLNRQKVSQLTAARRAAIRARSYCLIGFYACLVSAADLLWMTVWRIIALGQILRPCFYVVAAGSLVWLGWTLLKKSRAFAHEAALSSSEPPTSEPDFSKLGDGSQILRDLENLK